MMPMVFWASLPPCPSEFERRGGQLQCAKPGVDGKGRRAHARPGHPQDKEQGQEEAQQRREQDGGTGFGEVPLQTITPAPAFATPAPTSPPISACELLDGIPTRHVMMFHAMASMRAAKITRGSMTLAVTIPVPIVCRHVQAEEQKGDEVEEGGPGHGVAAASARASRRSWRSSWPRREGR